MPATPEYAAAVLPGLEAIAAQEIEDQLQGTRILETRRGWTVFRYPDSAGDLLRLRTTEDVFAVLFRTDSLPPNRKGALPLLTRMASSSRYWDPVWSVFHQTHRSVKRVTFRVIAQMVGRHGYRRQEVRDAVVAGVQARWPNWKQVADSAHTEIWVSIADSWATIAVRLSDRRMRHRTYKEAHRPASLRPTMAAAMVALSQPQPGDRFCDPMCGAGTILAERAQYGPYREMTGGDLDVDVLDAARTNLSQVRAVRGQPTLCLWDARRLPLRSNTLDAVVSNLPFGKQMGDHADNPALYTSFLGEAARILRPGGRAILLTSEKELMRGLIRHQTELNLENEVLVGLLGQAARIYVLRKAR